MKIVRLVSSSLFLVFSFVFIFIVSYFFAYQTISNPFLGSDALNNLNMILYLREFFPDIPFWFPNQGGGMSITAGYPQLHSYSAILINKLTGLTLDSSIGILNFLSIFLPAWGTSLFVWLRMRTRLGAVIAGFLFLLSPLVYVWITTVGFLAQAFSLIFVPPFLMAFDWLLEQVFEEREVRLALFLSGVFATLAFLAHPATGMGLMIFSLVYTIGTIFIRSDFSIKERLFKGISSWFLVMFVIFAFGAFWIFPLQSYFGFSDRDINFSLDTSIFAPFNIRGVLGLQAPDTSYSYRSFSVFPPVWILAVICLLAGYFYHRKSALLAAISLVSIVFIGSLAPWSIVARFSFLLAKFFDARQWYPLASVLLPIAASMGIIVLAKFISENLFALVYDFKKSKFKGIYIFFQKTIYLCLGTFILFLSLYLLTPVSGLYSLQKHWVIPVGPLNLSIFPKIEDNQNVGLNIRDIWIRENQKERCNNSSIQNSHFLCNTNFLENYFDVSGLIYYCEKNIIEGKLYDICQLNDAILNSSEKFAEYKLTVNNFISECTKSSTFISFHDELSPCLALRGEPLFQFKNWPKLSLGFEESETNYDRFTKNALEYFPDKKYSEANHRVDVSAQLGDLVKVWDLFSDSSILNAYAGGLILNKPYNGFFRSEFYSNTPVNIPVSVDNLAKYFGVEGVLTLENEPRSKFESQKWQMHEGAEESIFWEPPFGNSIYSIEKKPRVLVIGSKNNSAYEQIFKSAVFGGLPFDQGILIDGKERVDDYSQEELVKYHGLILHGYSYRDKKRTYDLLEKFVRAGGRVFIDTGWQYVTPDWGQDNSEAQFGQLLPVSRTRWGDLGNSWEGAGLDEDFSTSVDLAKFEPLVWQEFPWNLAYAEQADLADWAQPILTLNGKVIMAAGQLGEGKIVWSGMNYFSHAFTSGEVNEYKLLANIFNFLLSGSEGETSLGFRFTRQPDKLEIDFTEDVHSATFYFKESYFPYWSAKLVSKGKGEVIQIQETGPHFMSVLLNDTRAGDKLIFEIVRPFRDTFYRLISIVVFIYLVSSILVSKLFNLNFERWVVNTIKKYFPRKSFKKITSW